MTFPPFLPMIIKLDGVENLVGLSIRNNRGKKELSIHLPRDSQIQ